jgi:zinc protease
MRIAVVEKHSLPVVTGRIQVDAGAVREPASKAGLALVTARMLSEGTTSLTGAQIAEKMADLGAQFGTSGTFGSAAASITSLSNNFPEALKLAASTITSPSFTAGDFSRILAQSIAGYEQSMSQGSNVASKIFVQSVYDSATPYSRLNSGTKASLSKLTRDDVVNWHKTMYSPATTTVMLVGDITPAQARAAVEKAFAGWTNPAPSLAPLANKARAVSGTRVILVDRPGSVQTSISVGQAVPAWDNPDYFAILGASQILGGGFGARINMNLREKHGWTYGAFAGYNPLAGVGTFAINSEVRTNATDSALAETVREYKRIAGDAVSTEEVRDQMNNIVASFPSSVQTVQGLLARITNVVTYGLPVDFYGSYRERIAALTPNDIARVGKSVLTPNDLTIVAVGDLKSIEAPIRALNLGTVEVWDVDGNKIR